MATSAVVFVILETRSVVLLSLPCQFSHEHCQ